MSGLADKKCKPCEGGTDPLNRERTASLLTQVPGWRVAGNGNAITRDFGFKGFLGTISFVNAMAWVAHQQGHHPDFKAGYDYCNVTYTTHAIGGLSENDFICAHRLNQLVEA